ncbi:hypothetical protein PoB_006407500 [Plakobranchus ocellatus]|uniref:Uncharacterized protein n=1 Tax=Plakobranchus ocellatus TaxID=259542 RepID=A0AAV4D0D0_9GAST|nr:hypothetical protein PoB_006407500 [Plakobranchus ocellatus]
MTKTRPLRPRSNNKFNCSLQQEVNSGSAMKKTGPRSYRPRQITVSTDETEDNFELPLNKLTEITLGFHSSKMKFKMTFKETIKGNCGMPDAPQPHIEILPSPTHRELSISRPLSHNMNMRTHSDNTP